MSVGVEALDADHRHLLDITATLEEAVEGGASGMQVGELLQELIDYADTHLSREEYLMEKLGFEDTTPHIATHDVFRRWISDLHARHAGEDVCTLSSKVLDYLNNWWINHILKSDMEYKHFFSANAGKIEGLLKEWEKTHQSAAQ